MDREDWAGGLEPHELHLGHAIVALLAFPFLVLALALAAGLERVWPRR